MTEVELPIPLPVLFEIMEEAERSHTVRVAEVEALVLIWNQIQIVTPRGTEASGIIDDGGWRDIIRDLRTLPWYDKRVGWGHAGFLKGAQGVVDKGLFGYLTRDLPVAFLGHSLGGGISVDASLMLEAMGFDVRFCITMGAPRALKKGTARRVLKRSKIEFFQFENPGDPVPTVPWRWWRFRHLNSIETDRERVDVPGPDTPIRMALVNHMLPDYKDALLEPPVQIVEDQ